jgi:hypothetical protein
MGHSSINVTMDTYGHLMKAVNQDAAKKLDEAVFGSPSSVGEFGRSSMPIKHEPDSLRG